ARADPQRPATVDIATVRDDVVRAAAGRVGVRQFGGLVRGQETCGEHRSTGAPPHRYRRLGPFPRGRQTADPGVDQCEVGGQGDAGQLGNVQAHCLGNRTFGAVPTCDDLLGSAQSTIQQRPCLGQFHVIEVREVVVVSTFPTLLDELVDLGGDPGVTEHTTAVVIENKDQGVLRTCLGNVGSAGEHADDVVDV